VINLYETFFKFRLEISQNTKFVITYFIKIDKIFLLFLTGKSLKTEIGLINARMSIYLE